MYEVWADGVKYGTFTDFSKAMEQGNMLLQSYNVFFASIKRGGKLICARMYNQKKWRNLA